MPERSSYREVLKSSSIMGGVAAIGLLLGMIRTKFAALLIGTAGAGLTANFIAIQSLVAVIAGAGIQSSAVREVAAAHAAGDALALCRAVLTLRRVCWLTGLTGTAAMVLASAWISELTFGSPDYQAEVAALGIVILVSNIAGGQSAVLQGTRRIGDLGRIQIVTATAGTVFTIGAYFWLGLRGIVPALVGMALIRLAVSWRFARQVQLEPVKMSWSETWHAAGRMVRLGITLMWTGLMASAVTYTSNSLISRHLDLNALGVFSAAFALSGVFVTFVLGAMSTDYFPRLAGVSPDKASMNRLANEQTEVGLLLSLPGLLATLTLAPWVIQIFYTRDFLPATPLLHWFILGCVGRVLSWPLGFIIIALGRGKLFLLTETTGNVIHLGLVIVGLQVYGLEGVAIAFFAAYAAYIVLVYSCVRRLTGFTWAAGTWRIMLQSIPLVAGCFLVVRLLPLPLATATGLLFTSAGCLVAIRGLLTRVGSEHRIVRNALRIPGVRFLCGL